MPPASPTNPPQPVQLRLTTGDPEPADPAAALNRTARHLLAIQHACQLVHDVAYRHVLLDDETIDELRQALNTLDAAGPLPGRLGYLTKLLNTGAVGNYRDVVDDLAFAVHLNESATP